MDERDEMVIRHDERIAKLEVGLADAARMIQEAKGYQEGWWQARRDSLIEDVRVELNERLLYTLKRLIWIAATAVISGGIAVVYAALK